MDISKAFDALQEAADADPDHVREARRRRDLFKSAFDGEDEVVEVVASGSLARGTQRDPIHDVDVIIVFDAAKHPEWGAAGQSAADALSYTGQCVNRLLGVTNGTFAQEVRLARPGNHAVKCFLDDPEDECPFTVDAMPALRQTDGTLLVPEAASEDWITTDPEHLVKLVADKQTRYTSTRPLIRVIKLWKDASGTDLKSLTAEVLTLDCLPENETSRPRALSRFFSAAELAIEAPIMDPADLCGEIQPDLDLEKARAALSAAATASWQAISAQEDGDTDRAACLWCSIFGDAFPEPEGGCPVDTDDGRIGEGIAITGIAGGTAVIGETARRPVKDAPQG